ncbi:hypothetical protein EYF80_034905 [Liparis tanakae]|uniref:Uncharacterized protein n=1 Tax=Liparis tanakae TaxID=230148 RepID=A0A4Z2GNZ8_9TELE|nr:hypothetical protein EYF80_034905 [Liparis tanakae]
MARSLALIGADLRLEISRDVKNTQSDTSTRPSADKVRHAKAAALKHKPLEAVFRPARFPSHLHGLTSLLSVRQQLDGDGPAVLHGVLQVDEGVAHVAADAALPTDRHRAGFTEEEEHLRRKKTNGGRISCVNHFKIIVIIIIIISLTLQKLKRSEPPHLLGEFKERGGGGGSPIKGGERMCLLVDNVIANRLPLSPGVPILTCGLAIMWSAGGFYKAETKMKVTPLRGKRTLMRFTLK